MANGTRRYRRLAALFTTGSLYGLNHFLKTAKTGSPTEIAETISSRALALMTGWLHELVPKRVGR
jgi:hypothetical protein